MHFFTDFWSIFTKSSYPRVLCKIAKVLKLFAKRLTRGADVFHTRNLVQAAFAQIPRQSFRKRAMGKKRRKFAREKELQTKNL